MATLSEEQLNRAAEAMKEEDAAPIGIEHYRALAKSAAPFLQLPWDEPTTMESREITDSVWEKSVSHFHDHEALRVMQEFVRRRNAALLPKPVDPRREALLVIMREELKGLIGDKEFCSAADRILAALDEVK